MTTNQRERLAQLARNSQPVTLPALVDLWHCSVATARDTLALCGYVLAGDAWHHPDHAPAPEPHPEPHPEPLPAAAAVKPATRPTIPTFKRSNVQTFKRSTCNVQRPLPAWVAVDPIDLIADLEATRTTRTWLLANVEPSLWPHPHRTPCPDCPLWQPCLTLSRHRQATICEAVITQRRLSHANLPDQPDLHRTPARFGPPGQEDLRDLHPAQSAAIAAR